MGCYRCVSFSKLYLTIFLYHLLVQFVSNQNDNNFLLFTSRTALSGDPLSVYTQIYVRAASQSTVHDFKPVTDRASFTTGET